MIAIQLIDEHNNVLQSFDDPVVAEMLLQPGTGSSICLRFIDPYGDTVFNALQLPELAREIRERARGITDPAISSRLEQLAMFIDRAIARLPHVYVRFFGE